MKKKIRELTPEDIKKICSQYECFNCPLKEKNMCLILADMLDKEIEIK